MQKMSLHPPSYFQLSRPTVQSTPKGELYSVQNDAKEVELASLKKENLALKQQLNAATTAAVNLPTSSAPTAPTVLTSQSAVLANDLLQVEAHLQSRVRLMEAERKELLIQMEKLRHSIASNEGKHATEMAEFRHSHQNAITKVELERDCLKEEFHSFKLDRDKKVSELEQELTFQQQRYDSEMETLNSEKAALERSNADLMSRIDQENSQHQENSAHLQEQLASGQNEKETLMQEMEEKLRQAKSELAAQVEHVVELESYLGGEIPGLGRDGISEARAGLTWKEERESLRNTVREQEHTLERLQSESKLLHIRLASLSEILSIQETDIAKQSDICVNGDGDKVGVVKQLLSRWREKVFVLLFQQKLYQMEETKKNDEKKKEAALLLDQIDSLGREKEMLSHALADRTAELELQTSKTLDIQEELKEAGSSREQLELQLSLQQENVCRIKTAVHEMAEMFNCHRATSSQALTKIASLDQRLGFVSGRMSSLTATLNCKLAMMQSRIGPLPLTSEFGCQTGSVECDAASQAQGNDLSSFSRDRLEHEVVTLAQERDSLVAQLREGTESFQQQIRDLNDTCASRLAVMEGSLCDAQRERTSIEECLSTLQSEHTATQEENSSLSETVDELKTQLRDKQATFETKLEMAVQEVKQKSISDLGEMEKLVNIARREHAKAVVQLQQLQGHLARDRDHAVEAVKLSKAKLEHELECCRRKLQATQVERNLLMTTLRQEGIVIPAKQSAVRTSSEPLKSVVEGSGQLETEKSTSLESICDPPPTNQSDATPLSAQPPLHNTIHSIRAEDGLAECGGLEGTDIREVLKDLQMLSASLLGMETEHT